MLTGENGILKKAITAKEKTERAQLIESAQTDILGKQADVNNKGNVTKGDLNEVLNKYFINVPNNLNSDTELTATSEYGSYKVTLSEIYKGQIIEFTENDVTASKVANNPSKYYGKKVTNYQSQNGQDNWKIFYSDGTHIFLISGDYVDLSAENRLDSNTGITKTGTNYGSKWNSVPDFQETNNTVMQRFMSTKYTLDSNNVNSKCASTLLNANNWRNYKDSDGKADYAIGGATIEMWLASWNNLYKNIDGELFCNTDMYGYYVGTSENSDQITFDFMATKQGYNNELYYPHTSGIDDGNYLKVYSYWLASPHKGSSNLLKVECSGDVIGNVYNGTFAIRPVVSLNSTASVNITD